jgi:hypothetical protein
MDIFKSAVLSLVVIASTPSTTKYVAPEENLTPLPEVVTTTDIPSLIEFYAVKYGVSKDVMHTVVKCESGYKPNAVGDGGNSFGLSQIHLPSWGGQITKEQALDPNFALEFMAEKLSKGKGKLWTCYRMFYA